MPLVKPVLDFLGLFKDSPWKLTLFVGIPLFAFGLLAKWVPKVSSKLDDRDRLAVVAGSMMLMALGAAMVPGDANATSSQVWVRLLVCVVLLAVPLAMAVWGKLEASGNAMREHIGALKGSREQCEAMHGSMEGLLEHAWSELDRLTKALEQRGEMLTKALEQRGEILVKAVDAREEKLVQTVEDATRRVLTGFPAIFAKALGLLKEAERELWFVSFTPYFGAPHVLNREIIAAYGQVTEGRSFPSDVEAFWSMLHEKVGQLQIDHVTVMTLGTEPLGGDRADDGDIAIVTRFFRPLRDTHKDYVSLDPEGEWGKAIGKRKELLQKLKTRARGENRSFRYFETESLPIQAVIAGIPGAGESAAPKFGCLAFMLGTDILPGMRRGQETGLYTELESATEMYRQMCEALTHTARLVASDPPIASRQNV